MGLFRKRLILARSRGVAVGEPFVFSMADWPDTAFPPLDEPRTVARTST